VLTNVKYIYICQLDWVITLKLGLRLWFKLNLVQIDSDYKQFSLRLKSKTGLRRKSDPMFNQMCRPA